MSRPMRGTGVPLPSGDSERPSGSSVPPRQGCVVSIREGRCEVIDHLGLDTCINQGTGTCPRESASRLLG